jgi:protein required for attachment to host cells
MVQHRIPCFIIADGGHARFVWPADNSALHTRESLDSVSARKQDSDLVSDRPGRSFESASVIRHAYTPRTDPHELEKTRFARAVGEKACALAAEGAFNELILVAPANVLVEIKSELDASTEAKLIGTLSKDLVGVPDHELQPHLRQWVRPAQRS